MRLLKVFLLQEVIPSYRVPIFARLARLEGVDLTVFYSCEPSAMQKENLKNASNIRGFRHVRLGLLDFGSVSYQFGILWRVMAGRPDVVITGQLGRSDCLLLLLLCKLMGIRMYWFSGGVPWTDETRIRAWASSGFLNRVFGRYNPKRLLARTANGMIAYSEHAKSYFTSLGFSANKIYVAPNSPDTDALERYRQEWLRRPADLETERKRFAPSGQKILFLLGRLNRERKVDVLLHVLQRLHAKGFDLSLVIVGDGGEREYLRELATHLGLDNVFFEGAIYGEMELSKYFMIADIFVVPGAASLALKMAMAFGKPVITGDYGLEVHDVEDGVNGFIVPVDNVEVLTEKIRCLLESDDLRKRMGEKGSETISKNINIGKMIEGFRRAIFSCPAEYDS
jgi:glycosyltransferase involved in cell wall biosynthesis